MNTHRQELIDKLHQQIALLSDGDLHRLVNFAGSMLTQRQGKREQRSERHNNLLKASFRQQKSSTL
jgi:hypothetical protein